MTATKGVGVDIILHSLGGRIPHTSWQCVAEFGSLVNICPPDFEDEEDPGSCHAKRNLSRIDVDLRCASRHRPDLVAR